MGLLSHISSATILALSKPRFHIIKVIGAYAAWLWTIYEGNIKDAQGKFDAVPVNVKIRWAFGKARYFNGKDSHVKTSQISNWKALPYHYGSSQSKRRKDCL